MATASPEILRAARTMLGMQQKQMSKLAGISTPTLHKIESGNKRIAIEYVERLQAALEKAGVEFLGEGEVSGEGLRWRTKPHRAIT
ncbi:helix-turn-helix transcriptional regulator [Ensifer sp. PDNC004]|uniref:helix-turn-helix domain-containing protein n=1 Tax=Ensifer sp. PDNC004 TaxID=2811423 RepID=UPI001963C068|nr:helix-turn-helix transcriptional regulator [Ensifer sp. PDNC004]QRY69289.1 helix-turn-helix transcriptional regulator [Ensifer sp. PDNC004]